MARIFNTTGLSSIIQHFLELHKSTRFDLNGNMRHMQSQ